MNEEVSTTLYGKVYTYKYNGKFYSWFDYRDLPVPLMLHSKLREKAISEGKDASVFLSIPKSPSSEAKNVNENNQSVAKNSKKKPSNLINPFQSKE